MSTYRSNSKPFRTALLGLLAGCLWFSAGTAALSQQGQDNSSSSQAPQQRGSDSQIQADVAYALTHDATLQGQPITCATADGIVNLSGTVQTNAQFQRAETVASNVPGVAGIVNNIKVANPGSPEPPPPDQAAANSVDSSFRLRRQTSRIRNCNRTSPFRIRLLRIRFLLRIRLLRRLQATTAECPTSPDTIRLRSRAITRRLLPAR
jgi:BON domain